MEEFAGNVINIITSLHAKQNSMFLSTRSSNKSMIPDVIDAFKSVADEFPLDAQEVIDYFEDTYIGRLHPGGHRRAPLFDLALWNMYDQFIWKFIDILKWEQSHVNISQARAGHQPEPECRRYQDSNRRIKNIVQDYHNRDRLQYLRSLAHNISM